MGTQVNFKHCWEIVGSDVSTVVLDFFETGKLEPSWNSTTITMVPKVTNAERISEYRPIACLNAVYKVIAKLLTKRLQLLMPHMIQ